MVPQRQKRLPDDPIYRRFPPEKTRQPHEAHQLVQFQHHLAAVCTQYYTERTLEVILLKDGHRQRWQVAYWDAGSGQLFKYVISPFVTKV